MAASNNPPPLIVKKAGVAPAALSGTQMVNQFGCQGCHKIGGKGGQISKASSSVETKAGFGHRSSTRASTTRRW